MKKIVILTLFILALFATSFAVDIIPIRTDVSGFPTWTDTNVVGTTYLQLLVAGASTVTPAMNFDNFSAETLVYQARSYGGANAVENTITISISTNNGADWAVVTTVLPASSTMTSQTPIDLSSYSGTQVKVKFSVAGTSNTVGAGIDNITVTGTAAGPVLTVSVPTLSGFTYVYGSGPSTEQSFTILGSSLSANVSVAAPANYEISKSSGTGWATPLVYTPAEVATAQTVYVRLKAGLAIGSYNTQAITATSTGATSKTVTCSGTVSTPPPPDAPLATDATAISHDGFTAHWDAVPGVTEYSLDVLTGAATLATDLFFSEYIEGSSNNKYIEIFNGTGATVDLTGYFLRLIPNGVLEGGSGYVNNQLSGSLQHGECIVYKNSSAALTLPDGVTAISNSAINFNGDDAIALYKTSTSSYVDIFGRIGEDPGTQWGTSPLWTINTTLVRKSSVIGGVTTNPTSGFPTLTTEWDNYPTDTALYLGSHSLGSSLSPVSGYEDLTVNDTLYRVSGLDASTLYTYRVRAVNVYGNSINSNPVEVNTTASTAGVAANTTVGGASTVFTVPAIGTYTDLTVEIDPDTATNDDFTVTVAEIASGLTYTISTPNNLALNGVYLLNHAGLSAAPTLAASIGTLVVDASDATASIVTISGISAKGTLVITAEDGGTLPVELSSFTAAISTQNFVRLMWVTESETNVNGYYIYRNTTNDENSATLVSDMISATNTSQQASYQFLDKEVYEDGLYYYWLQSSDIDGSSTMHGPTSVLVNVTGGNTTPVVPLVTELQSVYPNPFNPSTSVRFAMATKANVSIDIYNVRGQLVRSLLNAEKNVGNHRIEWNGKDANGNNCTTGIYYIKMTSGKDSFLRKAVMIK
ncbi:MAG: hypothetical protein CVU48_07010 [Candidatus Cloacimonetes bacterium HGW-Cloacimonetes-1]|jgi:hypothetical protein|nr:MAG: hypothetical protein CVU48_07010 [Candidatus Cloacimonetes bacterium HGW-Cloacimonetes-1]